MKDSARSSIANVTSPPAPAPACARPAGWPSSGATSSRKPVASSIETLRGSPVIKCGRAGSAAGPLAQRHLDGLVLAVADDSDVDGVARVMACDQLRKVRFLHDLLTVYRCDDVAAHVHRLTLEPDPLVGAAQACLVRRPSWNHLRDQRSAV